MSHGLEDQGIEDKGETATAAKGEADETPIVALGGTAALIALVFILALGLAALAYAVAS